jgi:hypothetical protein
MYAEECSKASPDPAPKRLAEENGLDWSGRTGKSHSNPQGREDRRAVRGVHQTGSRPDGTVWDRRSVRGSMAPPYARDASHDKYCSAQLFP